VRGLLVLGLGADELLDGGGVLVMHLLHVQVAKGVDVRQRHVEFVVAEVDLPAGRGVAGGADFVGPAQALQDQDAALDVDQPEGLAGAAQGVLAHRGLAGAGQCLAHQDVRLVRTRGLGGCQEVRLREAAGRGDASQPFPVATEDGRWQQVLLCGPAQGPVGAAEGAGRGAGVGEGVAGLVGGGGVGEVAGGAAVAAVDDAGRAPVGAAVHGLLDLPVRGDSVPLGGHPVVRLALDGLAARRRGAEVDGRGFVGVHGSCRRARPVPGEAAWPPDRATADAMWHLELLLSAGTTPGRPLRGCTEWPVGAAGGAGMGGVRVVVGERVCLL
jgi:hypothetical protein